RIQDSFIGSKARILANSATSRQEESMSQDQDAGLIKRGLFLLALMSTLVVVLFMILYQRPTATLPVTNQRPELTAAGLVLFDAAFPGSVSWTTIGQLNDAFP